MIKLKDIIEEVYGEMEPFLLIPDYEGNETYPGDIKPGMYDATQARTLVLKNRDNEEALQFIADMLEDGEGFDKDDIADALRDPQRRKLLIKTLALHNFLDTSKSSLNEQFTIAGKGEFTKEQIKQLLIKNRENEKLLDDILWNLKTTNPEEELFVSGMQKLINNPKALQMVINYFNRIYKKRNQKYKGYTYVSKKKKERLQKYRDSLTNQGSIA